VNPSVKINSFPLVLSAPPGSFTLYNDNGRKSSPWLRTSAQPFTIDMIITIPVIAATFPLIVHSCPAGTSDFEVSIDATNIYVLVPSYQATPVLQFGYTAGTLQLTIVQDGPYASGKLNYAAYINGAQVSSSSVKFNPLALRTPPAYCAVIVGGKLCNGPPQGFDMSVLSGLAVFRLALYNYALTTQGVSQLYKAVNSPTTRAYFTNPPITVTLPVNTAQTVDLVLHIPATWASLVKLKIINASISPNLIFQTPFPTELAFDGSAATVTLPIIVGPAYAVPTGVYTFTIQVIGVDGTLGYHADSLDQTVLTVNVL